MMRFPFPCTQNQSLATVSTFSIGGPARYFTEAKTCEEMQSMLAFAFQASLPVLVIGKGSNCLFDDRGYGGMVICSKIDTFSHQENKFRAGSGYSFARLGAGTARRGWSGLEFAAGIPATVGGAVYMNAGANGQETQDCLCEVTFLDERGESRTWGSQEMHFSYRASPFQNQKGAIVEAVFALQPSPTARTSQKKNLEYRLQTQPYKEHSAGCAFRNPKPYAAGQLIEACGLKGMQLGGAQVSPLHANFIINTGGATANEVMTLMQHIKEEVYLKKEILLEEEIRYIPYSND